MLDDVGMKLFRRRTEIDHDASMRHLAKLRLELLVAMATIDDRVPICELDVLHNAVESLGSDHQHRHELEQYLFELLDDPPTIHRARRLVMEDAVARENARTLTNDLLRMALSDGSVQPAERDLLEHVRAAFTGAQVVCA